MMTEDNTSALMLSSTERRRKLEEAAKAALEELEAVEKHDGDAPSTRKVVDQLREALK